MASPDPRSHLAHLRQTLGAESAKVQHLHPLEKVLIAVVMTELVFLPWAVGGMYFWTQIVAGALAALALLVALVPRHYTEEHHNAGSLRLVMWPRLLRFPFFWVGVCYFIFVLIQIFNPAWQYVSSDKGWWLEAVDYIKWLPHGIADTPVLMMNGWRTLLIQGTAWMLVCALWVGLTRRKSARILVTGIAANGGILALTVLAQRLTHAKYFLWFWPPPSVYFVGSFIYKNHAGAFFLLILASCLGLAWWHNVQAEKHLKKSSPAPLLLFYSVLVFLALIFAYARAASVLAFALIAVVSAAYVLRMLFRDRESGPPRTVTLVTCLLGAGFIALCVMSFNVDSVWTKFDRLFKGDEMGSVTYRRLATEATIEMAQDSLATGHGAGSFRFLFPLYQQNYPLIFRYHYWDLTSKKYIPSYRLYWEHAHNDYAELLAETGLVGVTFLLTVFGLIAGAVRRDFVYNKPALLILLAGPAFVALNAMVDFPAHNPAVLVTASAVIVLALRWGELSRR